MVAPAPTAYSAAPHPTEPALRPTRPLVKASACVRPPSTRRPARKAAATSLLAAALAVLGLAGLAGCAAAPAKMSFHEALHGELPAGATGDGGGGDESLASDAPSRALRSPIDLPTALPPAHAPLPPPVAVAAPEAVASEAPEGPPIDPVLIRFALEARSRRSRGRTAAFPADAEVAWRALVRDLDAYLARPLPQTPILELVRSGVTLEAEWDYDRRAFGGAPADLGPLVEERARRLARRIQAARALGQTMFAARPPGRLRWPVENAGLSSAYGHRIHPMTGEPQWHGGIDLALPTGRLVGAAGRGYVVRAGWMAGYGLLVEVRHPGEVTTRYGHLSALLCGPGDAVDSGQPVGLVGQTGLATGPHLHFEVWQRGQPSDPLAWLGGGSRLASANVRAAR